MYLRCILPLLVTQVVTGAPTLGDDWAANFQQNMAATHGNIVGAISSLIKPLANLVDWLFGGFSPAVRGRSLVTSQITNLPSTSTLLFTPFNTADGGKLISKDEFETKTMQSTESTFYYQIAGHLKHYYLELIENLKENNRFSTFLEELFTEIV